MEDQKKLKVEGDAIRCGKDVTEDSAISKLNIDCLRYIFSFLPIIERIRIQRVCKQWQSVTKLPWHDMKKLNIGGASSDYHFDLPILKQVLLLCGPCLTHIRFSSFRKLPSITNLLVLVKKMCPNLRSIDFGYFSAALTPKAVEYLADNYRNITEFSIVKCWKGCENSLSRFFQNNKLQSLNIDDCDNLTGTCFQSLPAESLTVFKISTCQQIIPENLSNALRNFCNLRTLDIEECKTLHPHTNEFLESLPLKSSLRILKINRICTQVMRFRDLTRIPSVSKLSNLHTLELSADTVTHDDTLITVGKYCQELMYVTVRDSNRVTNLGLGSITSLPKLEKLFICKLDKVTDKVFGYMPKLKSLTCIHCKRMKNAGFLTLMKSSENLQYLEVNGCDKVRDNILTNDAMNTRKNHLNNEVTLKLHIQMWVKPEIVKVSPNLHLIKGNAKEDPNDLKFRREFGFYSDCRV